MLSPTVVRGMLFAGGGVLAVGNGLTQPSVSAFISKRTAPTAQGGTLGTSQAAASLGRTFGPAFGGFVYGAISERAPYIAVSIGMAGNTCTTGLCYGGSCVPCGGMGEKCCAGRDCGTNRACYNPDPGFCGGCGGEQEHCCPNNQCGGTRCCVGLSCFHEGQSCSANEICHDSSCVSCGDPGQPCCNDSCNGDGCCDKGPSPFRCVAPDAGCSWGRTCANKQCTWDAG